MAAVAPAADKTTDLLQKLSMEPKSKANDAPDANKKHAAFNGGNKQNAAVPTVDRSVTPILQNTDPNIWYFSNGYAPYMYGGFDSTNEWEEYPRYDGGEMPHPGVYGDVYHPGYGYPSYGAYPSPGSPAPTVGHDGQLYGPQHYQYPAQYYQPPSPANAPYTPSQAPAAKEVVSTSTAPDQPPISLDAAKVHANGVANGTTTGNNGSVLQKPSPQNTSLTSNGSYGRGGIPSSGYQDPRFSFDGMRSPVPWYDSSLFPDAQHRMSTNPSTGSHGTNSTSGRSQNLRPLPHLMGLHNTRPMSGMGPATPGLMSRMYPNNKMYNAFSTGLGFRSNFYDSRTNGRWGAVDSKYRPRGRGNVFYGYSNENGDGLSELNRGPRANRLRNQKGFGPNVTTAAKGDNISTNANVEDPSVVPDKEQYNKADFPVDYSDAKFFVIKSYSEDDIHKSVKYNVWASTPNGNKKLDAAYQEAQEKAGGGPIFLFFSVNTSGQFVGVAEMVSPVDFNKTMDYWQQDKWNGCFSVKWHIVKDVPNSILKHITLENNDNKPVTNSRDTQEVRLEQGLQVLKLFKEHVSKTSILDDFNFYETRQKVILEKRTKQQLHKQATDGKSTDSVDEKVNGKPILQKPLEAVTLLKKEANTTGLGESKPAEENGLAPVSADDISKVAKAATEKKIVANGVTNGC
ncbi:uncharacterized protein A4U43_C03F4960 [Asparagus officinalis]|uniref:YTH domain-containing family protein n=1 Tax=Asparagus officinalis TaxID=4686 RepID=A0A5P1F9A3_ASPOF|nr:YTH domain-containing family protein 2-like [Asparagus officinalis]ONK74313.1 uncharacterized protein A4U43_C03F4960 [Asparagus officinalis]